MDNGRPKALISVDNLGPKALISVDNVGPKALRQQLADNYPAPMPADMADTWKTPIHTCLNTCLNAG